MKVIDAQKSKSDSPPSIGGVIVTHGHLASEFIAAAEMIIGPMPHVTPASIDWHDDIDVARAELERAIARVSQGRGVLLLTDMFGGAPTDVASMFLDNPGIEVVTGVNARIVRKAGVRSTVGALGGVSGGVREGGRKGIKVAGDLPAPPAKTP